MRGKCRPMRQRCVSLNAEPYLTLPPESLASHLDQVLGEQAAELDYRLKRRAHQVENLLRRPDKS